MTEQWPNYDVYQTRTERPIPLVSLRPIAGRSRPPLDESGRATSAVGHHELHRDFVTNGGLMRSARV